MVEQPQMKKSSGFARVLWWILAVACCGWGVLEFLKANPIAGVTFLAAAAAAAPPVRAWMLNSAGGRTPRWLLATLPFALLLVASVTSAPVEFPRLEPAASLASPKASVDVTAEVLTYQARYIGAAQACKNGFQAIADQSTVPGASLQNMYALASVARDQCQASRRAIGEIEGPDGLSSREAGAFFGAGRTCDLAYLHAQQTAEKLMKAIDGGMRPALVADYQSTARDAVGGRQVCEREIEAAGQAAIAAHRVDTEAG